jgi:hypothetical protein
VPATIALLGLAHPHAALYLQTLDALAEVGRLVLYDQDANLARHVAVRKSQFAAAASRGRCPSCLVVFPVRDKHFTGCLA